jgi:hypothetical protein
MDWARDLSNKNDWNFWEVSKTTFADILYKSSLTQSLDKKPNLIFVNNIDSFKTGDYTKLNNFIKESKHRFVLSAKTLYGIPKELRNISNVVRIGEPTGGEFFETMNAVMVEPDRELVREILEKNIKDFDIIVNIMKNNIWKVKNEQAWFALDSIFSLLYKISPDFQISLLSYLFPVCKIPLSYDKKQKIFILESIINKIKSAYKMNQKEALEQYNIIKSLNKSRYASSLAYELKLDDKEKEFMGIKEKVEILKTLTKSEPKHVDLGKWF